LRLKFNFIFFFKDFGNRENVNEKLIIEINNEKKLLEEQKKLLDLLKERIDNDKDQDALNNQNKDQFKTADVLIKEADNANDTQNLIDTIDLKNKELQNIVDEIKDIGLDQKIFNSTIVQQVLTTTASIITFKNTSSTMTSTTTTIAGEKTQVEKIY
jgi:hypothetical protein